LDIPGQIEQLKDASILHMNPHINAYFTLSCRLYGGVLNYRWASMGVGEEYFGSLRFL